MNIKSNYHSIKMTKYSSIKSLTLSVPSDEPSQRVRGGGGGGGGDTRQIVKVYTFYLLIR